MTVTQLVVAGGDVVVPGIASGAVGLPLGFLIGWRAGWKEHVVRAREDRAAGICSECLRPLQEPSPD